MSSSSANQSNRPSRPANIDTSKKIAKSAPATSPPETLTKVDLATPGAGEPPDTPTTDIFDDSDASSLSSMEESTVEGKEVSQVEKGSAGVATKGADTLKERPKVIKTTGQVSRKRSMLALTSPVGKRIKVDETETEPEVGSDGQIKLPFQSIKAIKMPRRKTTGPPSADDRPYGDTENHMNSMLIYWLDEQDKSYNEATQLFAKRFPENKAVEEAIRRRHIRALQRLAKKYGVKAPHEIDGVGKNTMRRGKKRAPRMAKAGVGASPKAKRSPVNVDQASPALGIFPPEISSITHAHHVPKYVRQSYKAIEKAAIVVWKDLEGLDFKAIRQRLDEKYNWSLGRATVEKYYHITRPRVYGAISELDGLTRSGDMEDQAELDFEADKGIGEDV